MRRFILALVLSISPAVLRAQQYVEVKTPNFTVITNAGEARGREIAEHFEQVRAAFGIFFNKPSMTVPLPLTIVAFQNPIDFQPFVPRPTDKFQSTWPATARHGEVQDLIALDTSPIAGGRRPNAPLTGMELADRLYVKLLIAGNFPLLPAWYEDGVLEYCAALRVTNKQIIYGIKQPDLMGVLQAQPWLRAIQLFGMTAPADQDWDQQRKTILYAQSWITVHYLMANRLGRAMNSFVDLVQTQHVTIPEAIRRAYGVEPPAFENAIRNYLTMEITEYKLTLPADFGKGSFESRKLSEADWLAAEADLHYHAARDHELGVQMYSKALARDANNAAANRGTGFSFLQRNEFDKAQAHLEKALAADPTDARTHYFLALLQSRKARVAGAKADLATMKLHLQKAVELNPNYADAYHLLSWTDSELKDPDGAHAAIEKAAELNPRNDFYALTAAQFDLQAKQYEKARPVLERLEGSDQAEVARFAHQALASMGTSQQSSAASSSMRQQITAPQWQEKTPDTPAVAAKPAEPTPKPAPANQKIEYLKGELLAVDCSKSPVVTLTVWAKGKSWVMYSADVHKLMLIGVENFSCNWSNVKAAVNYRWQADGRGELISLEID